MVEKKPEDWDKPEDNDLEPLADEGAPAGDGQMEDPDKPKPNDLEPLADEGAPAGEGQMEEPK